MRGDKHDVEAADTKASRQIQIARMPPRSVKCLKETAFDFWHLICGLALQYVTQRNYNGQQDGKDEQRIDL